MLYLWRAGLTGTKSIGREIWQTRTWISGLGFAKKVHVFTWLGLEFPWLRFKAKTTFKIQSNNESPRLDQHKVSLRLRTWSGKLTSGQRRCGPRQGQKHTDDNGDQLKAISDLWKRHTWHMRKGKSSGTGNHRDKRKPRHYKPHYCAMKSRESPILCKAVWATARRNTETDRNPPL